jgi:hypothetical protein|nr:MAG TPA: hypothetical protein [Caudoviricetes sp.]
MGTYTKNLKLETPNYTDNADIPALTKKNNEIIDSEMIKRANGLDYNEQTGVLQLTGNNSKVGSPIQIKNNLPVTSMSSGTELKVNNYKQLIKFTKEGKTEQKTYTGKNLLNYIDNLQSTNGLTNTINSDGSITTTGKPTTDYMKIVKTQNFIDFFEDGETYTISQQQPNEKLFIQVNAKKKDGTYSYYFGNKGKSTFKVDKATYVSYFIGVQTHTMSMWGDSPLTITNKYMLYKGTDTADTSYEPYVGGQSSPNLDYPQEIENVKGVENLFYNVVTSSTPSGITITQNDDGSLILNGTTTGVSIFDFKLPKALPAGTYTFSIEGSDNISNDVFLRARGNNGQMVTTDAQVQGNNTTQNSHTFTCEKEIVKVALNITTTGKTFNNFVIKPMLSKKKSNYVPYGSNYLQLTNIGKNLFNYTPVLITQVKSNLRTNNIYPNSNILLKKGTYILSFSDMVMKNNIKEFGVQLFDNNTQLATLTLSNNKKSAIFTINNDANISRLYTYLDNSDNNDATITYKNIQLEKGTVATDYEPYEEKNINVDLKGNELCSNLDKTTNNELIVENSKAKINKKIKGFTFTGDEEFTKRNDGDGSTTITFNLPIHEDIVELNTVSNMFSYEQSSTSGNEGMGVSIGNNKLVYIQIKRSRLSSLDVAGFKEFLKAKYNAGTPLKIQCELIEPEVIDLGKVDFDLIENSTLTCEEESDMQIDYLTISSNIFVQDNLDGNSNQKAPSVDAVNKAINKISNYSSEEQCIGEWFGEKHYRKVFEIDMDSTLKQMTIPTGIDMKQLTHAYGVGLHQSTIYIPLNFYNNLGWDSFHLTGKGANIILQRGDNFSITKVFITLEYTKNV